MVGERRRPVPGDRRRLGRRRARVRALLRWAVPMALSAVVVVLAVSAVAQIGPTSGPYRRTVDRGYAALAQPLVAESNASGAALRLVPARGRRRSAGSRSSSTSTPSRPTPRPCERRYRRHHATRSHRRRLGVRDGASPGGRPRSRRCDRRSKASLGGTDRARRRRRGRAPPRRWPRREPNCESADASWAACRRALRRAPGSARGPDVGVGARPRTLRRRGRRPLRRAAVAGSHSLDSGAQHRRPRRRHRPRRGGQRVDPRGPGDHDPRRPRRAGQPGQRRRAGRRARRGGHPAGASGEPRARAADRQPRRGAVDDDVAPRASRWSPAPPTPCRSWRSRRIRPGPARWRRGTIQVQVQPAATLTSVTSSPLVAVRGRPVTLIADVRRRWRARRPRSHAAVTHGHGRLRRRRCHHPGVRGPARPRRAGHVLGDLPDHLGTRHHRRVLR